VKPTNVPLTVRDFNEVKCGICFGCGCACGYIAYLKSGDLVDIYGHPHHPNNIGSLCSRGITLLQKAPLSPFRLRQPLLRKGDSWESVGRAEVLDWMEKNLRGKVAVFLGRHTDLRDYLAARTLTEHLYGDALYLSFACSTLKPRLWSLKRVILLLECEPVFSEPMTARWLVDAFERSAYIVAVSSRFTTASAKATRRLLLKPPAAVRFFEELAEILEGKSLPVREETVRLAEAFTSLSDSSLVLVGETLLRSPWRDNVISSLKRIRIRTGIDYAVVGDVSPFELGELPDFLRDLENYDAFVLFGNPAMYMSDDMLRILGERKVLHLTHFPNLTSHWADLVVPVPFFHEREFTGYRTSFGSLYKSPKVVNPPEGVCDPFDLILSLTGERIDIAATLQHHGGDPGKLEEGAVLSAPFIESWSGKLDPAPLQEEGVFLVCDSTLTDEAGHWSLWTHELESDQIALMNRKTAELLNLKDSVEISGTSLNLRLTPNVAEDVLFVPLNFEETQPFGGGIRPGTLLQGKGYRVVRLQIHRR